MLTEDLNQLDTTGLDKDFIIRQKLVAAGIVQPEKEDKPAENEKPSDAEKTVAAVIPQEDKPDSIKTESVKKENMEKTNTDDILLKEIDAFREKAQKIQSMIRDRENRVDELESQLQQKEAQNAEMQRTLTDLEAQLEKKHSEADALVTNVETQVDRVLDELRNEFSGLSSVSDSVEGMKTDLYDKVHNENVKVYRNIQGLLDETAEADTTFKETQAQFKKVNAKVIFAIVLSVLNMGVGVAILFLLLGIF
ncbi:MAG: hypothetical protein K5853_09230 [Lachnospiraceae bacterium]|nr:hypothetical protein [Lachnospiraceae bacterium]